MRHQKIQCLCGFAGSFQKIKAPQIHYTPTTHGSTPLTGDEQYPSNTAKHAVPTAVGQNPQPVILKNFGSTPLMMKSQYPSSELDTFHVKKIEKTTDKKTVGFFMCVQHGRLSVIS